MIPTTVRLMMILMTTSQTPDISLRLMKAVQKVKSKSMKLTVKNITLGEQMVKAKNMKLTGVNTMLWGQ